MQRFTSALDDLGIEHAEPERAEVALSGAQMRFDMPVNGYDAGINIFPDKETTDQLRQYPNLGAAADREVTAAMQKVTGSTPVPSTLMMPQR